MQLPHPRIAPPGPFGPADASRVSAAVLSSGLVRFYRPDQLLRVADGLLRYGFGPAVGPLLGRVLHPDAPALVDDAGSLTFGELDHLCGLAAARLAERGGGRVGVLARNSRAFYVTVVGAARAGVDLVYLNTGASAEQLAEACRSTELTSVVYDAEFGGRLPPTVAALRAADLLAGGPSGALDGRPRCTTRACRVGPVGRSGPHRVPRFDPPLGSGVFRPPSRHVILTSGTSGRPRGVARSSIGVDTALTVLAGFPFRTRQRHLLAAPGFHAWGWMNTLLTMLLSSTLVMVRRFDPEQVLALIERERCEVLVAVPVMLQRLVALDPAIRRRYDTSSLRMVTVSGSPLNHRLAATFMNAYGNVLFNLYGSTEAAFATVATPTDLRAAPDTAGRPLPGVRVAVVDAAGRPLPPDTVGRIVVGNSATFHGYTSGEDRPRTATGVEVGDLGRVDRAGRLFVVGRADDMVVTGGENVYPGPVEQVLEQHPAVLEAAVLGAPDPEFGEVLVAHVRIDPTAGGPTVPDGAELRAWAKDRLAPFQVPRHVVVHTRPLPRNAAGKLLKRELRQPG